MKILSQLLSSHPLEKFLESNFSKLPFSSPGGAAGFTKHLNWKLIEEIISSKKSVLRIVHNGVVIKDYAEMDFTQARNHHQQGHTLLLRFAEKADHHLAELAHDFAHSFHTPVDIQLYCTPQGHNAFGWHYDVEEVFILQCEGSKTYTIRPNTFHPNPLVSSIPKDLGYQHEKTPQQLKVTLEPGDWLYIPSGWWHIAQTQTESLHISVGLMPSSALDVISYLPARLAHNPFWRTRMPVHQTFKDEQEEVEFYQAAMAKLGKELAEEISSPEFILSFLRDKRTRKESK